MSHPGYRFAARLCTIFCTVLATGCADYEFTVNDKVVYTPIPLFAAFDIEDAGLRDCVSQSIDDNKVTRAGELQSLSCTHAGITRLDGLEVFTGLQVLKLQHNKIGVVQALARLPTLQQIDLSYNALRSVSGLERLEYLYQLDLSHNPALDCDSASDLGNRRKLSLTLPQQCR